MTEVRSFPLADVLSVTTGVLLSRRHMSGIYEVLDFMMGANLMTHQLPDASRQMEPELIAQYPWLDEERPPKGLDQADLMSWLVDVERRRGESLEVAAVDTVARCATAMDNLKVAFEHLARVAEGRPVRVVEVGD